MVDSAPAGEDAGAPAGRFVQFPGPEEAAAPADLRQLRRGPSAGGCPGGARPAAHPVPGHQRRASLRPRSAIRSRKPEPCQVSAWQTGLLSPPGVLSSVEATRPPWAPDTGKDVVRVQDGPES